MVELHRGSGRRGMLRVFAASCLAATPHRCLPAFAAQGAAEMDAEFYLRGLLGRRTSPTVAAEPALEARVLDATFAAQSVAAVERTLAEALGRDAARLREAAVPRRRALAIEYDRVLTVGAFGTGDYGLTPASVAGENNNLRNQFSFDLTLCSLFALLADARLSRAESDDCARRLGAELLLLVPTASSLPAPPPAAVPSGSKAALVPLSTLLAGVRSLLEGLKAVGYVSGWSLDDSDADEAYAAGVEPLTCKPCASRGVALA